MLGNENYGTSEMMLSMIRAFFLSVSFSQLCFPAEWDARARRTDSHVVGDRNTSLARVESVRCAAFPIVLPPESS